MSISLFGVQFQLYGLIVGIAAATGLLLMEFQAKKEDIDQDRFWQYIWVSLIGVVIGARLWHVATDFHLYQNNLIEAFYIWQGGMSILGAVLGGGLAAWLLNFILPEEKRVSLKLLADISVFGLPIAQAIGRWGNFVNQELYGWPTSLPWGIFIAPENRVPGFEQYEMFHPLFAYEMLVTGLFGGAIWWLWYRSSVPKHMAIGTGRLFGWYVLYYSAARFILDFLRIEKASWSGLGINQWILIGVSIGAAIWLYKQYAKK